METFGCSKSRQKSIIHVNAMSIFTEGGQRRELCSGNVSSGGEGISSIRIHAGAIPAQLGNIEEVLWLPALFTPSSSTTALSAATLLGTSAVPGSNAECFFLFRGCKWSFGHGDCRWLSLPVLHGTYFYREGKTRGYKRNRKMVQSKALR